jgi:hypothetical protein
VPQQRRAAPGKHALDGRFRCAQEREEVDVEEAIGNEQRLHVGLIEAEGELRRLEAGVDRHRDRAHRGAHRTASPGLVVAHENADEVAADAERVHRLAARRTACCSR